MTEHILAPAAPELTALARLVAGGGVAVLTGAGISTESGIPDYRGPTGATARKHVPMTYQAFTGDAVARRRYWARSHVGWRTIARASPNAGHRAVAKLQEYGLVAGIVTQNVDGLHQAGGAHDVNELHGRLDRVVCLGCRATTSRTVLDGRLWAANPEFGVVGDTINPDGDVELDDRAVTSFRMVDCAGCRGTLKPDVVFFGETVPRERVLAAFDLVDSARALLVLGSSLAVHSGRRFVTHAARRGIPVAIVNQGPTRGDDRATVRVDAPLGNILPALTEHLAMT